MCLPHRIGRRSRVATRRLLVAKSRHVLLAVSLVASLAGCRDLRARFDDDAVVRLSAPSCPDTMTAVGDSLRLDAVVRIEDTWEGMSMPGDRDTLYRSADRPDAFRWSVTDSLPRGRGDAWLPAANAAITPLGVLVASRPGAVWVRAASAGRTSAPMRVDVMPRVTHFAVAPRDTTVTVGDTVSVRAAFVYDGEREPYHGFRWFPQPPPPGARIGGLLSAVERDPDDRSLPPVGEWTAAHRALALERSLTLTMVAEQPGTATITPCAAGTRRDSVTIRIVEARGATGGAAGDVRDAPPAIRLATTPEGTSLRVGDAVGARFRLVNARLGNGPYRWRASTGDGWDTTGVVDARRARDAGSAFGVEEVLFHEHHFLDAGSFAVTLTVTDSAGRSATVVGPTYTVAPMPEATLRLLPLDAAGAGTPVVRLGDGGRQLAVAILGQDLRALDPREIMTMPGNARRFGVAPLRFGRTEFNVDVAGMRREERDVNADGVPDLVLHLDRATLRRNGDLQPGRNRLVMTGALARGPMLRGRRPGTWFAPPVRGVLEFTAVP